MHVLRVCVAVCILGEAGAMHRKKKGIVVVMTTYMNLLHMHRMEYELKRDRKKMLPGM